MGGFAWVTLATNDSYSLGALVLGHSLKRAGTVHQLAILITPGVTEAMRTQLSAVFNVVKEVDVLDSRDTANLALLARPELGITFTKLHCWRLTQYDKCVFLDADTLVLENCDELFDREELSAAPDVGWPDCFNSGVFVYKPSEETFKSISDFALVHGTFDGGDQGLLNLYFSDWATKDIAKHLPFVYNVVSSVTYSYLPALKQFRDKLKIIHFIGATKPWLQPFDTETGLSRVSADSATQSQSDFIQLWWNLFCANVHPSLSANMNHHRLSYVLPTRATTTTNFSSSSTSSTTDPSFVPSSSLFYINQTLPDRSVPPPLTFHFEPHNEHNTNTGHHYFTDPWDVGNKDSPNTQNSSNFNDSSDSSSNFEQNSNWTQNEHQKEHHHTSHHSENSENTHHTPHVTSNTHHQENHDVHDYYLQINTSTIDSFSQSVQQTTTFHKDDNSFHKEDNSLSSPSHHTKLNSHSSSSSQHPIPPPHAPHPAAENLSKLNEESVAQPNTDDNEAGLAGALATVKLGSPLSEEQHALKDHLRRQGWEEGQVDYMGRDSFDNIWAKICETLSTGPSPVSPIADLPQPGESKPAETQASATEKTPPREVRVEARRTSVPKAEKALETLFLKPNTMLQPTSETADPLTPPPFLIQPPFAPASAPDSKTDDAKLAESTSCPLPPKPQPESPACPLPPKQEPESPACPVPPKPQPESPACPVPPKPQPESPACPVPTKPQPESPACPVPPKPQPESPVCPLPPKPQPESPVCPLPPKPQPESPVCPLPPKRQPESPVCPLPPKPDSTLPAQPTEPTSCPLPKPVEPAAPAATPAAPAAAPAAPEAAPASPEVTAPVASAPVPSETAPAPSECPIKKPDASVAPIEQTSCPKPTVPQDVCPLPPKTESFAAPVESAPAKEPSTDACPVKKSEVPPPALVKEQAAPSSQLPETPPQSPSQQPEGPKSPVQSQPSTPTVTTATPPLSPPPVPSDSPVSAAGKLSVQTDIPQTPPVDAAAPPVVPQASSAAAPSDEPPIPPKRKGGRGGGGDQGKGGRGGKGGKGKK